MSYIRERTHVLYVQHTKQVVPGTWYHVPGKLLVEQVAEHLWDEETIDLPTVAAVPLVGFSIETHYNLCSYMNNINKTGIDSRDPHIIYCTAC